MYIAQRRGAGAPFFRLGQLCAPDRGFSNRMIFSALYERVLRWSRHPHATWYLAVLSFAESSFFPIPPDVMLAPMTLANRGRGWRLAGLTTVTSVLGGLAGYLIGALALEAAAPLLRDAGYWEGYLTARTWFENYGFVAVLAAGFSPVPYKVFSSSLKQNVKSLAMLKLALQTLSLRPPCKTWLMLLSIKPTLPLMFLGSKANFV